MKVGARLICGVDEAGRGPLAGPVFAASVILEKPWSVPYFMADMPLMADMPALASIYADEIPALLAQAQQALNFKEGEFSMWIPDVPTQYIDPPAIYLAANTVSAKANEAAAAHKLGVCRVINSPLDIAPTGHAETYLNHYRNQNFNFDFYPDSRSRTDTSVRIVEQPKHGRLVRTHPDATDYTRNHYQYIPDEDYAGFDHFVMTAEADGIMVQIYYTMSVSLPGEPTYALDENGQKTDDLSRCPKPDWKISSITPATSNAIDLGQ